jgi:hypothetical protein
MNLKQEWELTPRLDRWSLALVLGLVLGAFLVPFCARAQVIGKTQACNANGRCATVTDLGGGKKGLDISGTISASTTAKATASAPSYSEGTDQPLSQDLSGNLRIGGTINASSSAKATASAPSYSEGTDNPFSQDLAGWLRTRSLHTTAAAPLACRLSDGAAFISTLPVSASSLPLPTGAATESTLSTLNTKTPALGQATMANSSPVVIASNQSAVPVSGTFWQATQPVSAASLPLPTGAAQDSTLTGGTTKAINRGGAKGGTSAMDITGSSIDADHNALDVYIRGGAAAGGTSSSFSSAFPASGTAAGFTDGTNMVPGKVMTTAPGASDPGLVVRIAGGSASDPTSVSATGAAVPAKADYVGMNVGGNLTGMTGTANGLKVDGSAVTQPVSGTFWQATQPVSGTFWQATQPVSIAATVNTSDSHTTAAAPLACRLSDGSAFLSTLAVTQSGSWSLAANQSTNVAQINGVTPLMGAGNTGTGSMRVTIASDQANVAVSQATASSLNATVVGASADNAAAASNNVNVLPAVVETSSTMPTRTDGNRAALVVDGKGRLYTRATHPTTWSCAQSGITALTECKALTASTVHYVTHIVLSNGPTAQTLQVVYGTGTNCGTGQTALTSTIYLGVNGGAVIPLDSSPLAPASANAVCCKPSGSSAFSCTLAGYSE